MILLDHFASCDFMFGLEILRLVAEKTFLIILTAFYLI